MSKAAMGMALAVVGVYGTVRYTVALAGAPLALGVAAWLAAYLPARRATRANPFAALRAD